MKRLSRRFGGAGPIIIRHGADLPSTIAACSHRGPRGHARQAFWLARRAMVINSSMTRAPRSVRRRTVRRALDWPVSPVHPVDRCTPLSVVRSEHEGEPLRRGNRISVQGRSRCSLQAPNAPPSLPWLLDRGGHETRRVEYGRTATSVASPLDPIPTTVMIPSSESRTPVPHLGEKFPL